MQKAFLFGCLLGFAQILGVSSEVLAFDATAIRKFCGEEPSNAEFSSAIFSVWEKDVRGCSSLSGEKGKKQGCQVLNAFDRWRDSNKSSNKTYSGIDLNCRSKKLSVSFQTRTGLSSQDFDLNKIEDSKLASRAIQCCYYECVYNTPASQGGHGTPYFCSKYVNEHGGFVSPGLGNSGSSSDGLPPYPYSDGKSDFSGLPSSGAR